VTAADARAPSVVYVSAARLPSRMANGVQTLQMCDALADAGARVALYHFRQTAPELAGTEVGAFYRVRNRVETRLYPEPPVRVPRDFSARRLRYAPFVANAFLWARGAARRLARQRADLYITREPVIAWALTRQGLPTLREFHDMPAPLLRGACRAALRSPSLRAVVALTGALADDLRDTLGVPRERVRVLHDGVELQRYPAERARAEARGELGLGGAEPLVVYTGQLFAHKGAGTLVEAAARVPEARFLLLGGLSADRDALEARLAAEGIGNVTLAGPVEPARVPLYQSAADVLVLPNSARSAHSARYSSPMKLFEYMAAGRPIVASAVPCIQEVLEHGRTAWMVAPDAPGELAAAVRALLADPALGGRLGAAARAHVESFTWRRRAERVLDAARPLPE
jgi:glycosyltransferase involved in cell wall biosynthesis